MSTDFPPLPATFKIPRQPVFPDVTFERIPEGPLPRHSVTITPFDVARWDRLHDDDTSWSRGESPWGGPVAMPWILYFSSMNILGHEFSGVFSRYRGSFLAPIPVGSTLTVGGEVLPKYVRRGRGHLEWRLDAWLGDTLVQQHTKIWSFPLSAEDAAKWPERAGDGIPAEEAVIETLPSLSLGIHIDRLIDFEGPIPLNSHTDVEAAKAMGRGAPVAHGEFSYSLLCRLLRDHFGAAFLTGGSIDLRFLKSLYAGQTLTAHAERLADQDGVVRLLVWTEDSGGNVIAAGTASLAPRAS